MNGATRWARNKRGEVVHRSSCQHARVPWAWAECLPDDEIAEMVETAPWLRFGACCAPAPSPVSVLGEIEARHAHPAGGQ